MNVDKEYTGLYSFVNMSGITLAISEKFGDNTKSIVQIGRSIVSSIMRGAGYKHIYKTNNYMREINTVDEAEEALNNVTSSTSIYDLIIYAVRKLHERGEHLRIYCTPAYTYNELQDFVTWVHTNCEGVKANVGINSIIHIKLHI